MTLSIQRIEVRIDMAIAELSEAREFSPSTKEKLARIEEALTLLTGVRDALRDIAEDEKGAA